MNSRLIFFPILLSLICCTPKLKTISINSLDQFPSLAEEEGYSRPCSISENYVPDEFTERRTVRVNVHLINNMEGTANFNLKEGKRFYRKIINNANERLTNNKKMSLPVDNETPVIDPHFRYKLIKTKGSDGGVYHHSEKHDYYFLNKGKNRNNYDKKVVQRYSVDADSILNIFAISHHQDSVKRKGYKATRTGIALGTSLKISGIYSNRHKKPYEFATLLNHEIGHVLGLGHAWTKYDGCDDTPVHPNCWDQHSGPPCDGTFSNNVMDYNRSQMAYTPCQIGKIHKSLNRLDSRTRGLVFPSWCKPDTSEIISIDRPVIWKGDRDLRKNIVISPKGSLELHCRLSMAQNTTITIEDGGQLIMHNHAKIHNACGDEWGGIIISTSKKELDHITRYGDPKIENIARKPRAPIQNRT